MNSHVSSTRSSERGTALVVALYCVLVVGLVAAGSSLVIGQRIADSTREVNQAIARKLAEGGTERAMAWLTLPANMTATALPSAVTSYTVAEGHVDVTLDALKGELTSSSTVRGIKAISRVLYKAEVVMAIQPIDVEGILGCGIVTDRDITGNGNAALKGLVNLNIHSNHILDIQNLYSIVQNTVSSTVAQASIFQVKTGPMPQKLKSSEVEIPLLNWWLYESEAKGKTFTYQDMTQGGKSITRSNYFATAADFVNVVNSSPNKSLTVTGPVYIKQGPLSCGSFKISGGPLVVEGDIDIRVTGGGVVNITNCDAWPIAIAWKGGQLYFGGNSVSTITNWIYSETGGYMDFKGTSFQLLGGIMLRGKPAGGSSSLNFGGTPDIILTQMDENKLLTYFVCPGTLVQKTNFTLYAWQ